MTTKRNAHAAVVDLALELDAAVETDAVGPVGISIDVEAPPGYVWSSNGCHEVHAYFYTDRPAAWLAVYEDMVDGCEPCPAHLEHECEWCDPGEHRNDLQDEVAEHES